jgi:hypothetical protein
MIKGLRVGARVYALFDLTTDEIALLEVSI